MGDDAARVVILSSLNSKLFPFTPFFLKQLSTFFSQLHSTLNSQHSTQSWLIDTPGIKGFGVLDMQREEVGHYFREIFRIGRDCRYSDCLHIDEPGCTVCEAVKNGDIAFSRYESYLSMLGDITENKYR